MEPRPLGRTGYSIGGAGVGATALGGGPGRDAHLAQRALFHALERGVRLVEHGHGGVGALGRIGEVVRELRLREQVAVAIRIPALNELRTPDGNLMLRRVFTPVYLKAAVEAALIATRLEIIPIAQLGLWHDDWLDDETWPELATYLAELVWQGKVLHWGVVAGGGPAVRIADEPAIATIAVPYNVFARAEGEALFAKATERKVGLIAIRPLAGGLLGGDFGAKVEFRPGDARREALPPALLAAAAPRVAKLSALTSDAPPAARSSDAAREALEQAERDRREKEARIEASNVPELALRFALTPPAISAFAVGAASRDHVDAAIAAASAPPLGARVMEALAAHAWPEMQTG
ncbi:MAG: aldo/keto reductase [Deltaproteobacteria bacterium]|nr:aldo/keto reductase [Deltaproteobacteria bacterium]